VVSCSFGSVDPASQRIFSPSFYLVAIARAG
jgi:hypothetical protein